MGDKRFSERSSNSTPRRPQYTTMNFDSPGGNKKNSFDSQLSSFGMPKIQKAPTGLNKDPGSQNSDRTFKIPKINLAPLVPANVSKNPINGVSLRNNKKYSAYSMDPFTKDEVKSNMEFINLKNQSILQNQR